MKNIITTIDGTFGNKEIEIEIFPTPQNPNIIINIHGVFNDKNDPCHQRFAQKIMENSLANVVLFTISRRQIDQNLNISFDEKREKIFRGKTFYEEYTDVKHVLIHVLTYSKKYFGISDTDLRIILNGNSLGGAIGFFLAYEFSQIHHISTVGTGFLKDWGNRPILETFPHFTEFQKVIQNFLGTFVIHQGEKDNIFSSKDFDELFRISHEHNKTRFFYQGVNHVFDKRDEAFSFDPYDEVFYNFCTVFFKTKSP